jgi:hypothetical protein
MEVCMARPYRRWLVLALFILTVGAPPLYGRASYQLTLTTEFSSICGGGGSNPTFRARVTTLDGQPVANQPVSFALAPGSGGTVLTPSASTAADGWASSTYRADPNAGGVMTMVATITPPGGGVQQTATSIYVGMTGMVAESVTTMAVSGTDQVGDLTTTQLTLTKTGPGTPIMSALRLTNNPYRIMCHVNPPLPVRAPASPYVLAHLDQEEGVTAADLTMAYTPSAQPVALLWHTGAQWVFVPGAQPNPLNHTITLHVTPTTQPSLAALTVRIPVFVVVPLVRTWLPQIRNATP